MSKQTVAHLHNGIPSNLTKEGEHHPGALRTSCGVKDTSHKGQTLRLHPYEAPRVIRFHRDRATQGPPGARESPGFRDLLGMTKKFSV